MNRRSIGFVLVGITVLLILVFLGRYDLRHTPPEPTAAQTEPAAPEPLRRARPAAPSAELAAETPVSQSEDLSATNAATIYQQAFALYDALSKDEKGLLADWRTNVDASVEAELCEKIRPICDLMHKAGTVTNCDWGVEPLTFETKLPFLLFPRPCARAAIWSAAHCRANDPAHATDDLLSALRLGQSVSQVGIIGHLVDIAIQGIAFNGVASNLSSLHGVDGQRLAAAITDPVYTQTPSRAMNQEANMVARLGDWLASLSPEEFETNLAGFGLEGMVPAPKITSAAAQDALHQIAALEREMARVLAAGSESEYQTLLRNADELQQSNPLGKLFLPAVFGPFLDKVQRAAITREMLITALAVVQTGTDALQSHPDPATSQPFIYTETADGFELQSGYQTNGIPLKMQFK
jgi:hypothetical protein